MLHIFRFITLIPLLFSCAFLWASSAQALPQTAASAYVQELGNSALAVITNKTLSKPQKQARLEKVFSENVDIPWVGRFVLGRAWREASPEQRSRYLTQYRKFLMLHYVSRFTDYSSGTFNVIDEKDDGDGEYTVSMQLRSDAAGSEPVLVEYRVRRINVDDDESGFKIFDVIVEGVSLIATQRSEFSAILSNNGIDYLIDQLTLKSNIGSI